MDKIIEAISKLLPYKDFGIEKEIGEPIAIIIIVILVALIIYLVKIIKKKNKIYNDAITEITPQFDYKSIKKARQYYIETQYQNASPSKQEEPGFSHQYIARNKLIPFFIDNVFTSNECGDRFYLILADSGMGKTTFMVNLYLRYYSGFSSKRKYDLKLFRFSNPETLTEIKNIDKFTAKKTVLLLDALDEDKGILSSDPKISDSEAFNIRVDQIIEATKGFAEVLITCRTQYFPGQEADPYELKLKKPDETGYYTFSKIYISPFTLDEVKKYLKKKYGNIPFINRKKKLQAAKIVSKSTNLVMRPMLLSYIDYLIEGNNLNLKTVQIYDTLVSKWLQREGEKRKGISDRNKFISELTRLSQELAKEIYLKWVNEGKMFLSKEDTNNLANKYNIELRPDEITGQSLLTCDGFINWKFSHKSIMEFFLAKELHENPAFFDKMSFNGMDMAKKFYYESNSILKLVDVSNRFKSVSRPIFLSGFKLPSNVSHHITTEGVNVQVLLNDQKSTFPAAIQFCNRINEQYKFPFRYSKYGKLQNENGKDVYISERFRGFRLPTSFEINAIFSKANFLTIINEDVIFKPEKLRDSIFPYSAISFDKSGEWYCDNTGYGIVMIDNSFASAGLTIDSDTSGDGITFTTKKMDSATGNYAFHLIFVP